MEIFGLDILALVQNPLAWIPMLGVGTLATMVVGTLLDEASTLLSNVLTYMRKEIIKKIPVAAIRNWMLDEQLKSVEKTILVWQKAKKDILAVKK